MQWIGKYQVPLLKNCLLACGLGFIRWEHPNLMCITWVTPSTILCSFLCFAQERKQARCKISPIILFNSYANRKFYQVSLPPSLVVFHGNFSSSIQLLKVKGSSPASYFVPLGFVGRDGDSPHLTSRPGTVSRKALAAFSGPNPIQHSSADAATFSPEMSEQKFPILSSPLWVPPPPRIHCTPKWSSCISPGKLERNWALCCCDSYTECCMRWTLIQSFKAFLSLCKSASSGSLRFILKICPLLMYISGPEYI